MSEPLAITVYSDVICPWCYVGKRRLEAALAGPGMPSTIAFTWHPFELNPDLPADGIERKAYRAAKFGEAKSAEQRPTRKRTTTRIPTRIMSSPAASRT